METPFDTPWSELSGDEQVELWKIDQFVRQNFNGDEIATLLEWDVDPHESDKLIAGGCSTELAMRILKPLELPSHPGYSVKV